MFFWKNEKIYNQFKEISERYNSHFGEDFPVYLIIPFEVDEEAISKYNSVVNSCIKKMKHLKNRLTTTTEFIKHLEKSKCFFRAQKGVKYVHLGMGINRFRVVGIFVFNFYYSGRNQWNN